MNELKTCACKQRRKRRDYTEAMLEKYVRAIKDAVPIPVAAAA